MLYEVITVPMVRLTFWALNIVVHRQPDVMDSMSELYFN